MTDGRCNCIRSLALACSRRQIALRTLAALPLLKHYTRARQCVTLGVNQLFDLERQLHVTTAIKPLPCSALVRLKLRKLRFPESQNIGLDTAKLRNVANLEIKTIGDRGRLVGALPGK